MRHPLFTSNLIVLFAACAILPVRTLATTYHVDPSGDDGASGTADQPWRTVQHAANHVLPGDTVLAHPGTYDESVSVTRSGSPEAPIVFSGPGATLVNPVPGSGLSAFDVAANVAHVAIAGFAATAFQEAFFLRAGVVDVELRDCVAYANRSGIWISGATAVEVDGCVLSNNTGSGVRISSSSRDIVVRNTISAGNNDGLGCAGDADGFVAEESTSQVRFIDCTASANGEDGFDVQGDQVLLSGIESRANGCTGIKLYQGARLQNSLATGNRTGIGTTSFFGAATSVELINVTAVDNSGTQINLGRPLPGDAATASYVVTMRNVIASGSGKAVEISRGVTLVEDHNLFFRPDTTSALIVEHLADGSQRRHTGQEINEGVWTAHSGGGIGTWAIDPELSDTFRIAPSSPAVDLGSPAEAATVDRAGTARPLGNGVDIGPDEIEQSVANHHPWADPGPPRSVELGTSVRLRSFGSADPDGQPLTFLWDVGDGTPLVSGPEVVHLFAAAGTYTVTLVASDGSLTHTNTTTIEVLDPSAPTPTPTATDAASPSPTATESPTPTATEIPPTPTAAELPPSAMPTLPWRDSEIRPFSRPVRVRIRAHTSERLVQLRVVVHNAAALPRDGYEIGVRVDAGTCPAATTSGAPDFDRHSSGAQPAAVIRAGRNRRVDVPLLFAAGAFFSPDRSTPHRCRLTVTSHQDGEESTPHNNAVAIDVEVVDENDL